MQIPEKGLPKEQVLGTLQAFKARDMDWKSGKVWCYVYNPGDDTAEVVKEAYLNAGRPDAFNEEKIYYLTDDQFGYAAGIDGLVMRDKPATMFYMGAFYAESLILAETGNSIGAIQIAGTAMPAQLPFFVAACDYTLIGEELFAASAYLSKEPKLLGSLKGQDVGKAIILLTILLGILLTSIGAITLKTSELDKLGWYNIGQWFDVQ